jgi:hypothetical protein
MRSGHSRSCRADALSCARSFTDSPHHFDSGDYKLRPPWRITQKIHGHITRFPSYAFSILTAIRRNATAAYNESHLFSKGLKVRSLLACMKLSWRTSHMGPIIARLGWSINLPQGKMAVFWVVAPCSLVEVYQRFRGPCCLHHQGVECWGRQLGPLKRW